MAMKLFKVGGAVRDKLLRQKPKDIDFCAVGSTEEEMKKLYGEPIGQDFPVYLGKVPGYEQYGMVEIAMARTEKKTGPLHTDFEFEFGPHITLEQDLKRRDFTINAMAEDLQQGGVIDPFGGIQHLKDKLIVHTNRQAFIEDPLRVLRMARFAAKCNFRVSPDTMNLAKEMDITHLTIERIWWEIRKALDTPRPELFFETLRQSDHLKQILPELHSMIGVDQAHHDEDSYDHVMMVIGEGKRTKLSNKAIFALLLHDLGKGVTPKKELPHHYNHESTSKELARQVCNRLKVPTDYQKLATWFAQIHMKLHKINDMKDGKVIRIAKTIESNHFDVDEIITMSNCDSKGRLGESYDTDFSRLKKAVEIVKTTKADEFVERGFKGPKVGELLHQKMTQRMKE
jgi:tRNA nucleotidyltransferase (CCA-adding enzyme)